MTTTDTTIIEQLSAAVRARKDSLSALRERISSLLAPIPVGVVLADDQGEVCRILRVCTGASQWSNQTWTVTIRGRGAITPSGKLLCDDLDSSYFDGSNMHHRSSEPTCRYRNGEAGDELGYEPGKVTRDVAARLPAAIALYMEVCARETAANESATKSV